jgi:tellurite resistance protein
MHTFVLFMSFFSIVHRCRGLLSPLLLPPALIGSFCSVATAQVGPSQGVNFGQALINSACTVSTSDGSIGVRSNRSLITSDSLEGGNFNGTLAAATVSAVSNLTTTGFVKVDNPTLTGATGATTAQVKLGTGTWGSSGQVNLGADGTLAATPLHVKFSTTSNNNRFANGTYTASATVSCYDGI